MRKQTVDKVAMAYQELVQIPCRGVDTIHMSKALTWLESVYSELTKELNESEQNKEEK